MCLSQSTQLTACHRCCFVLVLSRTWSDNALAAVRSSMTRQLWKLGCLPTRPFAQAYTTRWLCNRCQSWLFRRRQQWLLRIQRKPNIYVTFIVLGAKGPSFIKALGSQSTSRTVKNDYRRLPLTTHLLQQSSQHKLHTLWLVRLALVLKWRTHLLIC